MTDARSIAETDSAAIAYYFYAMEKGKQLDLARLVDAGLYITRRQSGGGEGAVASSDDEDFLQRIACS